MKKLFLSLAAIASCLTCAAQHTLTVDMQDIEGDTLTISLVAKDFKSFEEPIKLVRHDGVFTYDLKDTKARSCQMIIGKGEAAERFIVYLVPGEHGTIKGNVRNAKWSGSAFYEERAVLDELTAVVENKMYAVVEDFWARVRAGANKDSLQKVISPKYGELSAELQKVRLDYVKAHPNSNVSASLLMEIDDNEAAYKALGDEAKKGHFSYFADAVKRELDEIQAQREAEARLAPGNPAPDITLNDIKGKPFSLKKLRGKYVIIDFWGSWCGWCIKGLPEMKKYYEKYKGKLEILGVDCNDTEEKWKAAVEKHQLPWKHVRIPEGDESVYAKYAIQGFPTKVLVDPKGNIVKILMGENPAFYELLDQTLGKK